MQWWEGKGIFVALRQKCGITVGFCVIYIMIAEHSGARSKKGRQKAGLQQ
ncbi:hypothetical protein [Aquitalea sp. ASV11]|nr:hypothetical protein [Aquitalea sp. ASV11]